jgi:hypothetical protein
MVFSNFFLKIIEFLKSVSRFALTIPLKAAELAKVAQLVERDLAKVEVAGSNPVFRSDKAPATVLYC